MMAFKNIGYPVGLGKCYLRLRALEVEQSKATWPLLASSTFQWQTVACVKQMFFNDEKIIWSNFGVRKYKMITNNNMEY